MSMETTAWTQLHSVMNAQQDTRPFAPATLRRIAAFARPHRRRIAQFVVLSVVTALTAVATPVLAGHVVNTIVDGKHEGTVVRLALLIAVIAVAEAGLGLVARWLSANLGEGLILDLRTAVFDHVQRMPVAFFTRTRTGALVSRLNNDVIGAQRAFSNTLSGVVGNVVTLLLTLAVMLTLSWQITLLALVLLPVFVVPARRMGTRMARLQREAAAHNAAMGTRMTERFSAPGATLIKLFGRPGDESAEFAARASRVRDIGVRTAMAQSAFITALTLVSALALALVYGLGGYFAIEGTLDAGAVVSLALLLTRLYAPLTSLAGARVEVMSALVSFERVFEVLDLKPLIDEKPDAREVPEGPVAVEFEDVRFGYPSADKVSLASLEEVASLDTRGGAEVLHGISFRAEPGQTVALVGTSGSRQVDRRPAHAPPLRHRRGHRTHRRGRRPRPDRRIPARDPRHGHPGRPPLPRQRPRQPPACQARSERGRAVGRAAPLPPRRTWSTHCPTASTPSSASAATASPAANASA